MSTQRHTKDSQPKKAPTGAKRKAFAIRMRPSVFEAGQIAAKQQNRSLASLMETLLILHLREHGLLSDDIEVASALPMPGASPKRARSERSTSGR